MVQELKEFESLQKTLPIAQIKKIIKLNFEACCFPKSRLNNHIIIKSDQEYNFLIQKNGEGNYQIEEILDKQFLNYQSDNNGTIIVRNNQEMRRIEIYKSY